MDDTTLSKNMELFDFLRTPDPKYTKRFTRGGGFAGTAINATWVASRLTAAFGPVGQGWGVQVDDERYVEGHVLDDRGNRSIIHVLRISLWWRRNEERHFVTAYGQTTFVGATKNGVFTDEEAPKKSLTDAMTKAASWLGVAADIHMGLFDDNKYVQAAEKAWAPERDDAPGIVVTMDEPAIRSRWEGWKKLADTAKTPAELRQHRPGLVDLVQQAKQGQHAALCDEMAADYNARLARLTGASE
jgi:hypothetical protein